MTNKTFIIALISVICVGSIATGTLLYAGNNKTVAKVEQDITEQTTEQAEELSNKHVTESTWQKINDNLFFDTNSVKTQSDYIEGVFKQNYQDNDTGYDEKYAYKTIWTGAYCDIKLQGGVKKLEYPIYKYYDIDGSLLYENNIHKAWAEQYPDGHLGIMHTEDDENGEIYFKTLCKYFKN